MSNPIRLFFLDPDPTFKMLMGSYPNDKGGKKIMRDDPLD